VTGPRSRWRESDGVCAARAGLRERADIATTLRWRVKKGDVSTFGGSLGVVHGGFLS